MRRMFYSQINVGQACYAGCVECAIATQLGEILQCVRASSVVHRPALPHDCESVEQSEDGKSRLMNRHYDNLSGLPESEVNK